jgi:hypothetical protein
MLNNDSRIVSLYAEAGPQTTSVGCYRLSAAVAVEDLGGSAEDFERSLGCVCERFNWEWDPLARVIWIVDWVERNTPASPNVVQSWARLMKNVPNCDVKTHAVIGIGKSLADLPKSFREPWESLLKSFRRSESESEINQGDQEIGRSGAGSRRAARGRAGNDGNAAGRRAGRPVDERLTMFARETAKVVSVHLPMIELVDSFRVTVEAQGADPKVFETRDIERAFEELRDSNQMRTA